MRDDLHKSAPVPSHWRRLLKHCGRDADWKDKGARAAADAIERELREIRWATFARDWARDSTGLLAAVLFTKIEGEGAMALRANEHLDRLRSRGDTPSASVYTEAVLCTVNERVHGVLRSLDGFLGRSSVTPPERSMVMDRIAASIRTVDVESRIRMGMSMGQATLLPAPRTPFSVDQDLRR